MHFVCNKRALIYALIVVAFQRPPFEIEFSFMEHRLGIAGLVFLCLNGLGKVRVADFWRKIDLNNLLKQSLSQLTLTALFTKESRVCGLVGLLIYRGKLFLTTLPVFAKRSHHPPLLKEGKFVVCLSWYFIVENRFE